MRRKIQNSTDGDIEKFSDHATIFLMFCHRQWLFMLKYRSMMGFFYHRSQCSVARGNAVSIKELFRLPCLCDLDLFAKDSRLPSEKGGEKTKELSSNFSVRFFLNSFSNGMEFNANIRSSTTTMIEMKSSLWFLTRTRGSTGDCSKPNDLRFVIK